MTMPTKKKLLVLDLNGLLVERFGHGKKHPKHRRPDGKVGKSYVYRRSYCNEFLAFCFKNFEVGIWSSAQKHNVQKLVDFVFGDLKSKLVFCWYQSDCTKTGLRTLENKRKPVFLKELYKLWDKLKPNLPWARGDYGPFNTLLIDDTPYKAMRNPPHTAIFPYPYEVSNEPDDGLVGLLKYLEGISAAGDVQHYVECHRFGQPPISEENPHWNFYSKILFIGLPTANQNSSSVARTKMSEVANKTLTSIACNNGTTQSSSISRIESKENGVAKAIRSKKEKRKSVMEAALSQKHGAHNMSAVEKEAERNGSSVTTLRQKHATLNELEESGVAKATKCRKKKIKSAEQHALNQEHGAHNLSKMEKEVAFGLVFLSGVSGKEDGLPGAIVTTLSQKHASLNGLEESGAAKAAKSRKKRKAAEQASLDQEPGARNISPVEKEAAFGISEICDLDQVSKEDGLPETALTVTAGSLGAIITTFSQKHDSLDGLEESGAVKVAKARKKKSKGVEQAALSQEHGTHNISPVDEEVAFGIPQRTDLDMVSNDDVLFGTTVTCTAERHGASITALNQKHATLDGLGESGAAKAAKPRKKKGKGTEQAALNQEHGTHNISRVGREVAFGIPQQSDIHMVSKHDGVFETAVTCTAEKHGAIIATLSQKHATLDGLEECGSSKAVKPRKKKKKGAERAALTQEHGTYNISLVDEEVAFGIPQRTDLCMVSKDDGLFGTAVTCTVKRHGAIITPSSQTHATLDGLEESGAAKAAKPRKKKSKGAEHAALSQEYGTHIISPVKEDVALGIPQQSDLDIVSKDDGLFETEVTCMSETHGAIITSLSQKHATLNGLEENVAAKAAKPRKKKRKGAEQFSLNQGHGTQNISPVDKEEAFGIPQRSDIDLLSKDVGLFGTEVTCTAERHDAIITSLSQQHATLDGLEESGAGKPAKSRKKKSKGVEQVALSQEHGTHNISPVDKEVAFGIPQLYDLDMVSKDDGLFGTAVTCTSERHGAFITSLSQKHASLNGLEESGVAKAAKPRKKKREGAEQVALNQEHGTHNISPVDKEVAFGITQQSDLYMISKHDGLFETEMTFTAEGHGAIRSTLSQKHATLDKLDESGAAKAAKPRKRKREGAEQVALNQEHGTNHISSVGKERAFGIPQRSDLGTLSKDVGLFGTTVTCTAERHGATITTLSQQHATLHGLVESGAAKAGKPRQKKSKGVEQAVLSQEHGTHNISPVDKEVAFDIPQLSDLDMVSKDDGLFGTAVTCTSERHGSVITSSSQKHASLNGLGESGAAKAAKPRKKKREGQEQVALNQEHGTHNISPVDKEVAFGITQQSDLDTVLKHGGLFGTEVNFTAERQCAIISTLSHKHATLDQLDESGAAKAAKPRKKKSKGAEQATLGQEHGTHNISPVGKEVAFGIPQRSDLDMVSKDDCLFETAVTCKAERHGAIITSSSQKHATLNGLEESGAAKAAKPRKKKREGAEKVALNQEHGTHNISLVDKEVAFDITQQSDLDMVLKHDGLFETEVNFTAERHGAIISTLSHKHATLDELDESVAAKAGKPRKKKSKVAEQAALSHEHGTHNISSVDQEVAFGIPQRSDLDILSKDDCLFGTAVTCEAERHGAIITSSSKKHATLNGLDESGAAKAAKPMKKKREGAEKVALNQEHVSHNISPVDTIAFGIPQQSNLDMVSKHNGLFETEVTFTSERYGATITTLSQKHATLNELEESSLAKATKPRKKEKSVEQCTSNQEHGAHNISPVEKESAFGISQQADLYPVSIEDHLPNRALTFTTERHGAIITTLSQKHATLNGLEESVTAKTTKSRKKKKSAKQAASYHEHGAHDMSQVKKEAIFGISQQPDVDLVFKEYGLSKTAMTITAGRHGAVINTLSQKNASLKGLEESGTAKATKPSKKKKRIVEQAASNQEYGAHDISPVEKDTAFGISQQADLDAVSEEDGLPKTAVTFTAGRHGTIITTLCQKHATVKELEESGVAKATKPGKKKRKGGAEQAALNQERSARNISPVKKEAGFGSSQQSDLDMQSKNDRSSETAVIRTSKRNGSIVTTLS